MNVILLSGGSGKRLWPLSNDIRAKQFIRIFRRPEGVESMVQRVYRQIRAVDPEAVVTIATSHSQISEIHHQLGESVGISVEPCRRDTFPAIALATAYLHDQAGVSENEAVAVCPVDPYVEESYFTCVHRLYEAAGRGDGKLVLMGIEPTEPSEKFGYIQPIPGQEGQYRFTEKPTREKAWEYIRSGALWNGGVFAYRLQYVLEKARELLGTDKYAEMQERYETFPKISFDYAVAEKEPSLCVIPYTDTWKDLGTWNTLTEVMEDRILGNGRLDAGCSGVHIINELEIPILGAGLKDLVIAASPEGILVADKDKSAGIKPLVDEIDQPIRFAEKSWGIYQVLNAEENALTVRITVHPGRAMSYHCHEKRQEIWTITAGEGTAVVDGETRAIRAGDTIRLAAGCRHTIQAGEEGLRLIEIQLGDEITTGDKQKFASPWSY